MNTIDKAWSKVFAWVLPTCLLFISISYDFFTTYQFVAFFLFLACLFALIFATTKAIKTCNSQSQQPSKILLIPTVTVTILTICSYLYQQGFFYGKKVVDATFLDERGRLDLSLYSDGHYIIESGWLLGSETFSGRYHRNDKDIVFDNYPVLDNDFVAQTIIKRGNRIYFRKNEQGELKDTSFYFFKINSSSE